MLLAVSGVAIIFGTIGIVAETIISEAASGRREAKRMQEAVAALRDHYIVCGYGRVGSTVARELEHAGARLVVIDILPASLERAAKAGHLVVEGDATDDATLRAAGVEQARGLVTCIDSDANNVYVTLSARSINERLFVVARANQEGSEAKLLQAGANRVVSPYTMAGRRIAELALRPRVADFIDAALSHGELAFSMEEVVVARAARWSGATVGALRADGVVTLAILQRDGAYEPNPAGTRAFRPRASASSPRARRRRSPRCAPLLGPHRQDARGWTGGSGAVGRRVLPLLGGHRRAHDPRVVAQLRRHHGRPHRQARDEPLGPLGHAAAEDEQPGREQLLDRKQVLVEVRRPGLPGDPAADAPRRRTGARRRGPGSPCGRAPSSGRASRRRTARTRCRCPG